MALPECVERSVFVQTLHVRGRIPGGGIAIVGSRTPPSRALDFAFELARAIERPVVAGLAAGIDTAAHRGALAGGMPTVAFVGYGFGATYPPENAQLERDIVSGGGAVATLRAPGEPVDDAALVARDRLQVEYSVAVVLVASELGGGAMHAMRFARELGRPRFAVTPPGGSQVEHAWSGNVRALADGAAPLAFDVSEALHTLRARIDRFSGPR